MTGFKYRQKDDTGNHRGITRQSDPARTFAKHHNRDQNRPDRHHTGQQNAHMARRNILQGTGDQKRIKRPRSHQHNQAIGNRKPLGPDTAFKPDRGQQHKRHDKAQKPDIDRGKIRCHGIARDNQPRSPDRHRRQGRCHTDQTAFRCRRNSNSRSSRHISIPAKGLILQKSDHAPRIMARILTVGQLCITDRKRKQGSTDCPHCPVSNHQSRNQIPNSAKKSLPLSSITMKAGKSSTSIFQTASMPSSGYSRTSTFLMQSCARRAAGPPMEPR